MFHGPREEVVPFFEGLGFALPPRKGVADFLQEITSRKEQKVHMSASYSMHVLNRHTHGSTRSQQRQAARSMHYECLPRCLHAACSQSSTCLLLEKV